MSTLVLTLIVTCLAFTGIWLIQVKLRDVGVIDFYWAPGFFVILSVTAAFSGFNPALLVLGALVGVWSLRLTSHLVDRHLNATSEDARYADMRVAGGASFWWVSLFKIFLLQALMQWMIASPIHVLADVDGQLLAPAALAIGLLFYVVGMVIEVIADRQLREFKRRQLPAGSLLTTGLFSVCRHPNYLGEMIIWVGLGFVAYAYSAALMAFSGVGLLIVVMVLVSIPLTEDHLRKSRPGFEAWANRTPMLIPRLASLRQLAGA